MHVRTRTRLRTQRSRERTRGPEARGYNLSTTLLSWQVIRLSACKRISVSQCTRLALSEGGGVGGKGGGGTLISWAVVTDQHKTPDLVMLRDVDSGPSVDHLQYQQFGQVQYNNPVQWSDMAVWLFWSGSKTNWKEEQRDMERQMWQKSLYFVNWIISWSPGPRRDLWDRTQVQYSLTRSMWDQEASSMNLQLASSSKMVHSWPRSQACAVFGCTSMDGLVSFLACVTSRVERWSKGLNGT